MNCCPRCGALEISAEMCVACSYAPSMIDGFLAYEPELAACSPGYDSEHYARLATLESGNFWFKARNALILWAFRKYFPKAGSYLEIGCGTGFVLNALSSSFPQMGIHGSDVFVEGLAYAAKRVTGADLFQMDARHIPFSAKFDVVGAFDVIEHIDDDARVLGQIKRALKPGGGVILTVPQHRWLWSRQDEIAHHARRYTSKELLGKVTAAGFHVAMTTSFVNLLLPALAISRFRKRHSQHLEDGFSELLIPRWLDFLFLKTMQIETIAIKLGVRFPFGASRILIAFSKD